MTGTEQAVGQSAKAWTRSERVAVVGLGFAGLPTAVAIAEAGYETIGLDIDGAKVQRINAADPISGLDRETLAPLIAGHALRATTDAAALSHADAIVISVPTPIDQEGRPDERSLVSACDSVLHNAGPGVLVVLQSTVMPGATRRLIVEPFERLGRTVGRDVYVAFSPERINPGDPVFHVSNTAKLVAGATRACRERALAFVSSFVSPVHSVATLEATELAKLVENTFRFINISFVNELTLLCDRLGVSVWDVIDAAATKPFAFLPHYPGPGIGGDCIPVSPRYLETSARQHGLATELIPAGYRATGRMPDHVVDRCAAELGVDQRDLSGLRILVVGVAYKPDVADTRHSPAFPIIRALRERGAEVAIHDPLVPEIDVDGTRYPSINLSDNWPRGAQGAHAAIVVTPHKDVDYSRLAQAVRLVLDTRNALVGLGLGSVTAL